MGGRKIDLQRVGCRYDHEKDSVHLRDDCGQSSFIAHVPRHDNLNEVKFSLWG